MKRNKKYDQLLVGLVPGIVLPALTFILTWAIISSLSLSDYIDQFTKMGRVSSLISLSAIPNLLLFFIFIWLNYIRSARGVIFATLILAIFMLIVKYF
jgi:uncharacterized membrane protein SpoIIM required for sporulation